MNAKISKRLLVFLLAGSLGIYFVCTVIFGLGAMLPLYNAALPSSWGLLLLMPLAIFSGLMGCAYNYLLRLSISAYNKQKIIPQFWRPMLPFALAAILVLVMPSLTGEGMDIFARIETQHLLVGFLCFFLFAKLIFTAFCYGSGIPAGVMVPILCLGGVCGVVFGDVTMAAGFSMPGWSEACIAMGMAGAFAAAERAPVTGLVLSLEITGAYAAVPGMFLVAAIATFCARICRIRTL